MKRVSLGMALVTLVGCGAQKGNQYELSADTTTAPSQEVVEVKDIGLGQLFIPKTMIIPTEAGKKVSCAEQIGKLELGLNVMSQNTAFGPAANLCTYQERRGEWEYSALWEYADKTYVSTPIHAHEFTGFVYKDPAAEAKEAYTAVLIERSTLQSGSVALTCRANDVFSSGSGVLGRACETLPFGKVSLTAMGIEIAFNNGDKASVPFFAMPALETLPGQTFESHKKILLESSDVQIILPISASVGDDLETQKKYLELFNEWKAAHPESEHVYYSALGNMGTILALPIVRPLFDAPECKVMRNAVNAMRRVGQNGELDEFMLKSMEKAYPKTLDWSDWDCDDILRAGLEYLKQPTAEAVARLQVLLDSNTEKNRDLKDYMSGHTPAGS